MHTTADGAQIKQHHKALGQFDSSVSARFTFLSRGGRRTSPLFTFSRVASGKEVTRERRHSTPRASSAACFPPLCAEPLASYVRKSAHLKRAEVGRVRVAASRAHEHRFDFGVLIERRGESRAHRTRHRPQLQVVPKNLKKNREATRQRYNNHRSDKRTRKATLKRTTHRPGIDCAHCSMNGSTADRYPPAAGLRQLHLKTSCLRRVSSINCSISGKGSWPLM